MLPGPIPWLAAFAAFFVLATPAHGDPPQPFTFAWNVGPVRQSPVEQFAPTVVTNTTGCAWDADDNSQATANGQLAAGASASWTICQVIEAANSPPELSSCFYDWQHANGCGYPVEVEVWSPSSSLNVSLCFIPGPCFHPLPAYSVDAKKYNYRACVWAVYPYGSPLDQPIADSGGGHGVLTQETLTVANPTDRRVRNNLGEFDQIGWGQGAGGIGPIAYPSPVFCYQDGIPTNADADLTFRWTIS